jgi:hypothetical protein
MGDPLSSRSPSRHTATVVRRVEEVRYVVCPDHYTFDHTLAGYLL